MHWIQQTVTLASRPRGFHVVTDEVLDAVADIRHLRVGVMQVFIQHTSAALSLNENADPDVRRDLETAFNHLAPESLPYTHTCEGPDDMPAHVKASLLGASITIPIADGRPLLGVWQGIYLCEHRDHASRRRLVVTAWGERSE